MANNVRVKKVGPLFDAARSQGDCASAIDGHRTSVTAAIQRERMGETDGRVLRRA